jgi:mRNA export factor
VSDAPILCSTFFHDGTKLFFGGCNKTVQLWDFGSNRTMPVAQHGAPIKECCWIPDIQLLATGGWDKCIKYWDVRQPTGQAALQVTLQERVYAMDCRYPLLVAATAKKEFVIYNLQAPSTALRVDPSPLRYQIRSVALFPDKTGFAAGSVEGRVAVNHVSDKDNHKNFAFKW